MSTVHLFFSFPSKPAFMSMYALINYPYAAPQCMIILLVMHENAGFSLFT